MSYILEALKKAQAERQLGNAPTVHAPQPVQAAQPSAAASRRPLFIGLAAGALVAGAGALLMWHRAPAPALASAAPAAGAMVAQAGAPAAAPEASVAPSVASRAASDTLEVSAPPVSAPPAPPSTAPRRAAAAVPAPPAALATPAVPPSRTTPAPAAAQVAAPAPSPDDSLPYLRQLPDAVQSGLPRVSFGGYMYSANPADRLLLVDKTLRHEGEEVAPGLVLEKLLPKAAVMNYRGVRYRVAY
jgi:general secretion pathway protein B